MSSKDLVRGFLLAHHAPQKVLSALDIIGSTTPDAPASSGLPNDIKEWQLSVRTYNCLENVGIDTFKKLMTLSESELLRITNFGRKSLNELKFYINPHTYQPMGMGNDTSLRPVLDKNAPIPIAARKEIHIKINDLADQCASKDRFRAQACPACQAVKPADCGFHCDVGAPFPTNARNRINKIISGCMTRGMSSEATTDEVWEYLYINTQQKWYAPDDVSYENTMLRGKLVEAQAIIETMKSFAEPLKYTNGVCGAIVEFIEGNAL